jgi:pimeloyl-ACP methyl ester carboxylesterase
MPDYVICARNVKGKKFGDEPAKSSFLFVPEDALPSPDHSVTRKRWATRVLAEARKGVPGTEMGNILVFVHGYNNSQSTVMERHRRLRDDLDAGGFKGIVVSFDWPSGDQGFFYLEDLADANKSAIQLVADGIALLAEYQTPDCKVNIHLLAHSMGAYVTREAFTAADDADDLTGKTWYTSQVLLIAADISSGSLAEGEHRTSGLYRNCTRLTCYSNRHDGVLALSSAKRAGLRPRAGRVGLPDNAPQKAVNVDCGDYWTTIPPNQKIIGNREHSWHIGDPTFTRDMIDTLNGIDRQVMVTREMVGVNRFTLIRPE